MKALAIIFSNIHNETIDELTRKRTTASIPFGGRYRLIDFTLSNLVHAGVDNVGILAQKNYQSLMDHLGSGKPWDLSRKNGGLVIFPPFSGDFNTSLYTSRLQALISIKGFIENQTADLVVLSDCDSANLIDYQDVFKFHLEKGADITALYYHNNGDLEDHMNFILDKNNRIIDASLKGKNKAKNNSCLNIFVLSRRLLQGLLEEAIAKGFKSFHRDLVFNNIKSLKIYGYKYQGVYLHVNSMENYFKHNMDLLNPAIRNQLFGDPNLRIYTKVRDSAPTRYGFNAKVENSFIADGCEIEGTVINSILFRGVKVGRGTTIKNAILMQDTIIGDNVKLNYVITDKNVTIRSRNSLAGCEKIPYYLSKNTMV